MEFLNLIHVNNSLTIIESNIDSDEFRNDEREEKKANNAGD